MRVGLYSTTPNETIAWSFFEALISVRIHRPAVSCSTIYLYFKMYTDIFDLEDNFGSAMGRLIQSIILSGATTKINVAVLPSGLYNVRLKITFT